MAKKMILIEFNELSPELLTTFMQEGHLKHFTRFYESSQVYITDAGESPPYLNPWVQWVSVHTGTELVQHRVFVLGDGHKVRYKQI